MAKIDYLNDLRREELALILGAFPSSGRVLELGAGTGCQARILAELGYDVAAIDLSDGQYSPDRVYEVLDYDGHHIPFPDGHFDVVFSSNVLEHVADLEEAHQEMRRVLKPGGVCVHAMPTPAWRAWSLVTSLPGVIGPALAGFTPRTPLRGIARVAWRAIQPLRLLPHGERGNALTELVTFRAAWWRRAFRRSGFEIVSERPVGIFYTGTVLFGSRLPFGSRRGLSRALGSACRLYVTRPAKAA